MANLQGTLPVSRLVSIIPSALGPAVGVEFMNGLILTENPAIPAGTLKEYTSAKDVATELTPTSVEAKMAGAYFKGFTGTSKVPSKLYFYGVAAPTKAQPWSKASATGSLSAQMAKGATSGVIAIDDGMIPSNADVAKTQAANVVIDGVSNIVVKSVDTAKGATTISFTCDATADVVAQDTKATFDLSGMTDASAGNDYTTIMDTLVGLTQDFAGFSSSFPLSADDMKALAKWVDQSTDRYWYVPFDTDDQALVLNGGSSFGAWLVEQSIDGTTPVYGQDPESAAVSAAGCLGWMASLDFDAVNGRYTLADRRNPEVSPVVITPAQADALEGNGYTYMGAFANGLGRWQVYRQGAVSGEFLWSDSYINQIWLNASFQAALLQLLITVGQIPYTVRGDALMSAAVQDVINQGLNFGAIRAGVNISDEQSLEIDTQAGLTISDVVKTRGWYYQPNASTAPSDVRAARKSPSSRFWYTDGQSIQTINMGSIEVI